MISWHFVDLTKIINHILLSPKCWEPSRIIFNYSTQTMNAITIGRFWLGFPRHNRNSFSVLIRIKFRIKWPFRQWPNWKLIRISSEISSHKIIVYDAMRKFETHMKFNHLIGNDSNSLAIKLGWQKLMKSFFFSLHFYGNILIRQTGTYYLLHENNLCTNKFWIFVRFERNFWTHKNRIVDVLMKRS